MLSHPSPTTSHVIPHPSAATAHVIHLGCCILYDGVPGSWEWWVINAMSLVVMSLVGEFLCMRREMQARSDEIRPDMARYGEIGQM